MKLFLQIYYSLLFYVLYRISYKFINDISPLKPEYVFFAKPLSFFNWPTESHTVLFLLGLFCCLFTIFRQDKTLRVLTCLFSLVLFFILFSYGQFYHTNHVWILSSVLVCCFDSKQSLNSKQNFFILRLIQGIILSHYFMSGLWKLRKMLSAQFEFSLREIVIEHIAFNLKHQNLHAILKIFLDEPRLLGFGYFCVLVFQLSTLTPIFLNRYFKLYGILAILFHLSTGIFLAIYFETTVLGVLLFLIIAESIREYKIEK